MPRKEKSLAERFWPKVQISDPGSCWPWAGNRNEKGYGGIGGPGGRNGKWLKAHRVAYELMHGPIPDDVCLLHRCDNPPCVNPAHMFLGTKADNNRDMREKGRHCHGEKSHLAKLTNRDVGDIRRLLGSCPQWQIAEMFGVTQPVISRIKTGAIRKLSPNVEGA